AAASFRRRTDAVPVAANASAIHCGSIAALNCAKLAGRSPAPAARMASPTSIAPPPVGETSYYLVDKGSRTRAPYTLTDRHWLQRGDSPFARTSPLPGASTSLQPSRKELPCRDEPKVARR